tara:strand:+ start:3416 stop:3550 length:135 start_codon:yes stop_codon:yes gene_type:complete
LLEDINLNREVERFSKLPPHSRDKQIFERNICITKLGDVVNGKQ